MGQPVYCSAVMLPYGEREAWWWLHPLHMTQQYCLALWLPGFPPQAFPITISSITSPRSLSLQSTAALTVGLLHKPWTSVPSCCPFQETHVPTSICMALTRTVWFSFNLGCHRSAVSLSALNVSPLTQTIALLWGSDRASVPPPNEGRSTPTPVFPPSSFILLSFAWFYIFFSTGQVALFALSWCSACTSVSDGAFLIYPWREIYSTSTYSSAILSSGLNISCFNGKKEFN